MQLGDIGNHIRDLRAFACYLQDVASRAPEQVNNELIRSVATDLVSMFDDPPHAREAIFSKYGLKQQHRVWLGKVVSSAVQDFIDKL